ncbi:GFA family protein [Streptomyces naphthomycinicus]|uniref:GFA family protein n=1 Tax=Streptomyces naphthomycinicus TaxID=2872625 RepID=UPI0021F1E65C|nr:hypothetical protein [Streptomyces sp. TML10]
MWWVGFETVTWTGEGGEPTWYETFEGEAKRGFCPTCGSRLAAIDNDIPEVGINVTALDDTNGPDLVPIHASFHDNAVHWISPLTLSSPHRSPRRLRRPRWRSRVLPVFGLTVALAVRAGGHEEPVSVGAGLEELEDQACGDALRRLTQAHGGRWGWGRRR